MQCVRQPEGTEVRHKGFIFIRPLSNFLKSQMSVQVRLHKKRLWRSDKADRVKWKGTDPQLTKAKPTVMNL